MEAATSSKELWLVAEALDSVMDVFADDGNNEHLKELGVIPTLQNILPQLKTMVRSFNYMYQGGICQNNMSQT